MNEEQDAVPTRELQVRAEQLGDHDWRIVMEAATALARAGQAGLAAVLWGLSHHPNARVRQGCAGFLDHHATDACIPQLRWVALHDPSAKVRRVAVHSGDLPTMQALAAFRRPCGLTRPGGARRSQPTSSRESYWRAAFTTAGRLRSSGTGADPAHRDQPAPAEPSTPRAQTSGPRLQSGCRCKGQGAGDRYGQSQKRAPTASASY